MIDPDKKLTLREELSAGLGITIEDWDEAFRDLNVKGQLTHAVLIELFVILAKRLEALEEKN